MIRSTRKDALSGAAATILLGILIAVPNAQAQAAGDQYIPAPEPPGVTPGSPPDGPGGADGTGPESSSSNGDAGEASVTAEPVSDGSSGGVELPLSDEYPVTPFVVLIAVLLACSVAARALIGGVRRKGERTQIR